MNHNRNWIVQADSSSVRFFGRNSADILPGKVFFNWSCSGFEFAFTGTGASAQLYTSPWGTEPVPAPGSRAQIGVYVDGEKEAIAKFMLDEPEKWYTLVEGLPDGEHTVRVVKLTECGYGRAAVSQLRTVGSAAPRPTAAKPRRLEFIGDSITCGYGNECADESPEFVTREQNAARTYAAFLAERLNAELHCICASGNGIYHDYGMQTQNLMPELYQYTDKMLAGHYGIEPERWEPSLYRPDLIIIKLGANDSRYCDGWDKPEEERTPELLAERRRGFSEKLFQFLDLVQKQNPRTPILYIYESDIVLHDVIRDALKEYQKGNHKAPLYPFELMSKRPWEGVGANGHWSVVTHNRAAMVLEPVIRVIMGW